MGSSTRMVARKALAMLSAHFPYPADEKFPVFRRQGPDGAFQCGGVGDDYCRPSRPRNTPTVTMDS